MGRASRFSVMAAVAMLAACTLAAPVERAVTDQAKARWMGTYEGTMPCADCEAVQVTLILRADGSYDYTDRFVGTDVVDHVGGTYRWDASGQIIILDRAGDGQRLQIAGQQVPRLILLGLQDPWAPGQVASLTKRD